jgi:hypothetical protein
MNFHSFAAISAFCLFFGIPSAWSNEIILQPEVLKRLSERARSQPYRTRGGIFSREMMSFEIGRPVTPYFADKESQVSKRRYQDEQRCYEVAFLSRLNQVKRIACRDLQLDLRVPGFPAFKPTRVGDLASGQRSSFAFFQSEQTYALSGFLHDQETVRMDQAVLGLPDRSSFPRQSFKVQALSSGSVVLEPQGSLRVRQEARLTIGKLGILDARERNWTALVERKADQWVFSDGAGKVLLLNDLLLPPALRGSLMEIDPRLASGLQDLEQRSRVEPVCFRDSGWGPGELGCHRMVESIPVVRMSPFRLLLIDFNGQQVSALQ